MNSVLGKVYQAFQHFCHFDLFTTCMLPSNFNKRLSFTWCDQLLGTKDDTVLCHKPCLKIPL